jgi:D-alanine-D-alanine ligase
MRIALAYNAKPSARPEIRASGLQLLTEEEEEPPSPPEGGSEDAYAEWDDAETVLAIARALAGRHALTLVEAVGDFATGIRRAAPDLVFNIAEGLHGASREAQVPAILEMLGIPYTGSDPLTLAVCLDKARCKEILAYHGVPTAPFFVIEREQDWDAAPQLPYPLLVKPLFEGSSKGLRNDQLVRDLPSLRSRVGRVLEEYRQPALVEAFLPGREFTVALLGNEPDLTVLPPVEIRFDELPEGANPFYSWEAKWVWDRPEAPLRVFDCPARLEPSVLGELERLCRRTVRVLRIRDWCRIDVRMDGRGVANVIEVNPLPGVLPDPKANSCFPKAARAAGVGYEAMLLAVVDAAARRLGRMQ